MEEMIVKMQGYAITYGLNIVAAVIIFAVGKSLAKIITGLLAKAMNKAKVEETLIAFIKNIAYVAAMVFVIIAALSKLGVQTTSFVAVIGAAGLAVGLALQGSLSNFAAGVILILFKPFKVGDFIIAGGEMGTVREIQIFNTVIDHVDNRKVIIPNAQVTGGTITNFSATDKRRVDLVFGISYKDNIKTAKDILMKVVKSNPKVLAAPEPVVAVAELGESSVNLICRPWCKPNDYWDVHFAVLEEGKAALEKGGITIPFPQHDVHLYQEKNV